MADTVLSTKETEKLKVIELDMLKIFIGICSKLDIKYYVLGGTMLGAVRHKGFIPWDDDIDVGLYRRDYELFCQKAQELLPEGLFLQTGETDPEYIGGFAKIRNSNTTFVESSTKKFRINHGVYLDIFPLDYYPETKAEQRLFELKNRIIKMRLRREYTLDDRAKGSRAKEFAAAVASAAAMLIYPTVESACTAREKLYTSVKSSEMFANYNGAWGKKEIVPAFWYGEGRMMPFEDIQVCVPEHCEKWLAQVYGDYMQFPPEEKRVTHHFTELIDLDRPYTETRHND